MKFTLGFSLLAAGLVAAQNITVEVGKDQALTFSPNVIVADIGQVVEFKFMRGSHSVTQATFNDPCTQAWIDAEGVPGLDSGYQDVEATKAVSIVAVTITSKKPLWLFCNRKHCNAGMVMVINPPEDGSKTIEQFTEKAKTAVVPGYGVFANLTNSTTTAPAEDDSSAMSPAFAALPAMVGAAALFASSLLL